LNKKDFTEEKFHDPDERAWEFSRKNFILIMALGGVATQLTWLQSCANVFTDETDDDPIPADHSPLTASEYKTLRALHNVLFPSDGNGPGATEINATPYVIWVLRDNYGEKSETEFFIKRIQKFQQTCKEKTGDSFINLSAIDRTQFVSYVASLDWGKAWLSRNLILIFEALLLDPVYGGNLNKVGWKWLQHDPGLPRPKNDNIYPLIMQRHEV
jgi:gluconate 2-dehydrogenase gamma chain